MNDRQERFVKLLESIFELDKSDLDFGIYRIMNIRRAEIEKFFREGLPQKINEALAPFAGADLAIIRKRMSEIESQLGGVEIIAQMPQTAPVIAEYNELKKRLAEGADLSLLESDVYSALYSFFSRYYDDGDFISKRRYKEGVYALPYEGEEVKLYWANQDQYYIKSSENFRDYTFRSNETADSITVHFRLVDATTEQNNNKESDEKKRTFMLYTECEENPDLHTFEWDAENRELIIRFIYDIPANAKIKWHEENMKAINGWIVSECPELIGELLRNVSKNPKEHLSLIEKHLKGYVAKNSFDYFIHKDLGRFLRRELDFFIKNEVVRIDEIDTETESRVGAYLGKVRAIKRVGGVIIDFLAQVEEFQKRLWLKKKFVVDANYCIALDRIDERFYAEIAANEKQVKEWEEIARLTKRKGYTSPLSKEFLCFNGDLVVDTRYFDERFKEEVLSSLQDIDTSSAGELFVADNYHAINLLKEKYRGKVKCIYIDPPFNLPKDGGFMYKTNYCNSSWIAMLYDRIALARQLLADDGAIFVRCDYHGNSLVRLMLSSIFGEENFKNEIIINRFKKAANGLATTTESLFLYSKTDQFKFRSVEKPRSCVFCNTPIEPKWMWSHSAGAGTLPRYFTVNGERVLLYPPEGRHWTNKQEAIDELEQQGRIRIDFSTKYRDCNGNRVEYIPEKLQSNLVELDNNWTDIEGYEFGVFTKEKFSTQNAAVLLERVIKLASDEGDLVVDFFMGSGTTQAVAQSLNRRWIGVEMGDYFHRTPLKRLKSSGCSLFKYMRLENYEDTLSNIELTRRGGISLFGEEYLINYMLMMESRDSLLSIDKFRTPFDYRMLITERNECREQRVDLCETFNYLIGLKLISQSRTTYYTTEKSPSPLYEGAVELRQDDNGAYGFRRIVGLLPDGRRALVIWRNITDDLLASNGALDAYFSKCRINPAGGEYDVIYVNGDNNLENLRTDEEQWRVVMIEKEFNAKMWEE